VGVWDADGDELVGMDREPSRKFNRLLCGDGEIRSIGHAVEVAWESSLLSGRQGALASVHDQLHAEVAAAHDEVGIVHRGTSPDPPTVKSLVVILGGNGGDQY